MFYSTLIFLIAFLPLFTMRGVEGVIFSPMSHTYAFALTTAIVLAVTLTPVLSSFLLRKGMKETHNIVWEAFHRFYHNLFIRILRWPYLTLAVIILVMAGGLSLFPRLGGEFLPKLEEGNIWARATLPLTHLALSCKRRGARRARGIQIVSRGNGRRLSDRPSRRWHRHDRVLQYRIFRRSEAAVSVAARPHQAEADRRDR